MTKFYSYLVFDSSKELFDLTVRTLKDNGVFVYHKGQSFQPASDGKVYDWFVRLKKEEAPADKISFILKNKNILPLELPEKDKKDGIIEDLRRRIEKIRNAALTAEENYEKLKQVLQGTRSELFSLQKKIKIKDSQIEEHRLKYESLLKENEIYKQKTEEILKKSAEDKDAKWDKTRVTFFQAEIAKNKKIIDNLKEEKQKLDDYYNKMFEEFQEEHQKEIKKLEDEKGTLLYEIEKQKDLFLYENTEQLSSVNIKKSNKRMKYEILSVVFRTLLPNKKIIKEKQVFEYFQEDLRIDIFVDRVKNFDNVWKGKKVQGAEGWWEEHLIYDWRLYYNKTDQGWIVYVGLKKDQEKDIVFLKNHSE